MELIDSDFFASPHELIDRFIVNITSPGEPITSSYSGIFGFATIDITTEIVCEPEFTGTFCETLQIPGDTFANPDRGTTSTDTDFPTTDNAESTAAPTTRILATDTNIALVVIIVVAITVVAVIVILNVYVCVYKRRRAKTSSRAVYSMGNHDSTIEGSANHESPHHDHGYEYPSFVSTNTASAIGSDHGNNYCYTDCPAYVSDAATTQLPSNLLEGDTNGSVQLEDFSASSTSNNHDHLLESRKDNIQCTPCQAYDSPKPQGPERNGNEGENNVSAAVSREESVEYYDYESPYWAPADKKTELLSQFRKLRIQSVAQKDLE